MTDPARIEAAARELVTDWATIDAPTEQQRQYAHKRAGEILAAAYPELAAGTHWLAPMEATEGMAKHAEGLTDFARSAVVATPEDVIREWQSGYRLMRDAYLQSDKDKTT